MDRRDTALRLLRLRGDAGRDCASTPLSHWGHEQRGVLALRRARVAGRCHSHVEITVHHRSLTLRRTRFKRQKGAEWRFYATTLM